MITISRDKFNGGDINDIDLFVNISKVLQYSRNYKLLEIMPLFHPGYTLRKYI